MPQIQIGSTTHMIPTQVMRRLLKCAESTLEKMRMAEGAGFPKVDQQTLQLIMDIKRSHPDMV